MAKILIIVESVFVHRFASVISTVYVPSVMLVKSFVVAEFDHNTVYGVVPPLIFSTIAPSGTPGQLAFVVSISVVIGRGSAIVIISTQLHPAASVIVTE